jgi:hypothetical protein
VPTDLSFSPQGGDFVEGHSAVSVTVSTPGVAATDRVSGKGLRWLTPGVPSVSGTVAVATAQGLSWAYGPTGVGLRFSAIVTKAQGARSYTFGLCRYLDRPNLWA